MTVPSGKLTVGNAASDSREFRQWLVGDIGSWTSQDPDRVDLEQLGLRNTADIEVKWGVHPTGERRSGGWAGCSPKHGLDILLKGHFIVSFREPETRDRVEEVRLSAFGDYVLWTEELEHTWRCIEESLVLTVRWTPSGNRAPAIGSAP